MTRAKHLLGDDGDEMNGKRQDGGGGGAALAWAVLVGLFVSLYAAFMVSLGWK